MIQIPLIAVIILIVLTHTILTHLFNWGIRMFNELEYLSGMFILILISIAEIFLTITLLCNMKPA